LGDNTNLAFGEPSVKIIISIIGLIICVLHLAFQSIHSTLLFSCVFCRLRRYDVTTSCNNAMVMRSKCALGAMQMTSRVTYLDVTNTCASWRQNHELLFKKKKISIPRSRQCGWSEEIARSTLCSSIGNMVCRCPKFRSHVKYIHTVGLLTKSNPWSRALPTR
jgi:hypothetical protein